MSETTMNGVAARLLPAVAEEPAPRPRRRRMSGGTLPGLGLGFSDRPITRAPVSRGSSLGPRGALAVDPDLLMLGVFSLDG